MDWFRVILGMAVITIIAIICLIFWHKKVDSETTWIYGIYVAIILILFLFVLIVIAQS